MTTMFLIQQSFKIRIKNDSSYGCNKVKFEYLILSLNHHFSLKKIFNFHFLWERKK